MRYYLIFFLIINSSILVNSQSPNVELRGAWVATVANIDWPSKSNLSTREQKKEIISILNLYQSLHINTVFLQVRPSSDTFYPSKYEPWSKYLTGKQGKRPRPYYNPLKYWIKEAHNRGIELHAWINPYRITNSSRDHLSKGHPALMHPEWIVSYGGKKYFNPGIKECRDHIVRMVAEIVKNYQVDGIHFDDYFYPYPRKGEGFPDSLTFRLFSNYYPSIDHWRRDNVNRAINEIRNAIKSIKPHVKFGISPFGVWRNKSDDPNGSDTRAGITNYDHLYADILTWLEKGWIDYVTPQLYWSIENAAVPFEHLTSWWTSKANGKSVYIGHALYKLNGAREEWKNVRQLVDQINIVRQNELSIGSVFFSHQHLRKNVLGITDTLRSSLFKYPALIPAMPWINNKCPDIPYQLEIKKDKLRWKHKRNGPRQKNISYAVYGVLQSGKKQLMALTSKKEFDIPLLLSMQQKIKGIQVSAVNHFNNESRVSNIVDLHID
jgi:uncharacterized lipoprotein YddW (UPF0748 family)